MPAHSPIAARGRRPGGFTLVELLVVMGVIAVLAGMLVPIITSARRSAKVASTKKLLSQICSAIDRYNADWGGYPPDFLSSSLPGLQFVKFTNYTTAAPYISPTPEMVATAESLCYHLANPNLTPKHPYLELQADTQYSTLTNLRPVVDVWGRPFLYNRARFPKDTSGYADFGGDPRHNTATYDLYSVGPDGQTGSTTLPQPTTVGNLTTFNAAAINEFGDGNGEDDISNWK
jgi:prepilin-type N-terminal cleavage/methylation domain-containing protein